MPEVILSWILARFLFFLFFLFCFSTLFWHETKKILFFSVLYKAYLYFLLIFSTLSVWWNGKGLLNFSVESFPCHIIIFLTFSWELWSFPYLLHLPCMQRKKTVRRYSFLHYAIFFSLRDLMFVTVSSKSFYGTLIAMELT